MSAVIAGFNRGVAEEIDSFLRMPPFGLELHKVTGRRVLHLNNEFFITCSAETAEVLWNTYDTMVSVRQYVVIDGCKSWSNERETGVKRAGEPFPPYFCFTRRWRGRMAVVDAEFTAYVRVPPNRLWEHRRWLAAGGLADIEEPEPRAERHAMQLRGEEVAAGIRFMAALRR